MIKSSIKYVIEYLNQLNTNDYKIISRRSSPEDLLVYFNLLCRVNEVKNAIEIGTFNGMSALFIASAIEGTLYTIDISNQKIAKRHSKDSGITNIEFLKGDSLKVLPELVRKLKFDYSFVYIDGKHTYRYSKKEFDITSEFINRDKGLILLDDASSILDGDHKVGGVPRTVEEVGAVIDDKISASGAFAYKIFGDFSVL